MKRAAMLLSGAVGMVLLAFGGLTAAAAQTSCGSVTLDPGVELNLRHPSTTVSVDLPAGTYAAVGTSSDPAHTPGRQPEQDGESWSFVTDTGVASDVTTDLAADATSLSHFFGELTFPSDVSSITFVHRGSGNSPDSVHPTLTLTCVSSSVLGSTTSVAPTTTGTVTDTSAPPTTGPASTAPATTAPATTGPETSVPATTTPAPTTTGEVGAQGDPDPSTPPSVSGGMNDPDNGGGTLPRTGATLNLTIAGVLFVALGLVGTTTGRHLLFRHSLTNCFRIERVVDE